MRSVNFLKPLLLNLQILVDVGMFQIAYLFLQNYVGLIEFFQVGQQESLDVGEPYLNLFML